MLETNNPYMFGSSTTTTTTTTTPTAAAAANQSSSQSPSSAPPPSSSSLAGNQNTTTTTSNNNNNHIQQSRPINHNHNNNYYIGKGGDDDYYRNHQQSSRINPTFIRHPEEQQQQEQQQQKQSSQSSINYTSTYKANKSINNITNNNIHQHNAPERTNNFMRPSVHVYSQQQHIKREPSPNMLPPSTFIKSKKLVEEPDWYERENKSHKPSTPAIITSTTTVTTTPTSSSSSSSATPTSAVAEVSTLEAGDNKKIKRRKEMTGIMEDLNKDFIKKREKLYIEKLNTVNQELNDAHQDTHLSYIDGLRDLETMRKKTIDDGVLFRKYQNEVADNQFQLEIYQAEEEYTAEIQDIREKLFAGLDEKRRKLKEEKDNCDLAYDVILESQARLHKRNLRKREKEHPENKSSKKKQLTGPALVFKLKDDDILSDIHAMRNGLSINNTANTASSASAQPKKSNSSNKKK